MIAEVHKPVADALNDFLGEKTSLDAFLRLVAHQSIHAHELPEKERQLVFVIDGILAQTIGEFGVEVIREELANAIRPFESGTVLLVRVGNAVVFQSSAPHSRGSSVPRKPASSSSTLYAYSFVGRNATMSSDSSTYSSSMDSVNL